MLLRKLKINHRIWIINLLAVAGMLAILLVALNRQYNDMESLKLQEIQHQVDSAEGVVRAYQQMVANGLLTTQEAQRQAINMVMAMVYGQDKDYFFILTLDGVVLAHPSADVRNRNMLHVQDVHGVPLFRQMISGASRDGSVVVPYHWPRPGSDVPLQKISYARLNSEWNWIIATGVYVDDIDQMFKNSLMALGGIAVVILLIMLLAGLLIGRSIIRPIKETAEAMREISSGDGDLTVRLNTQGKDEITELTSHFNVFVTKIEDLVADIKLAVGAINTAAQEIAAGNSDLSQRTEEQASSLEETASSLEELTSTVRQNADNARQANQLSQDASRIAAEGGGRARQVVATMEEISESSNKIADITTLIDSIAFQTNILALNAAVEAARAGEQGRGFAVVAGEVRVLAQRSAAAAKEIKELITASVETVRQGGSLVRETGETIEQIVASVKRVTDLMGEISAASDEQSQGIEQVNQAVIQMDDVTQQNAALVEEAAAAAESLEEQSQALSEAVSVFRISADSETRKVAPSGSRTVAAPGQAPTRSRPAAPAAKGTARTAAPARKLTPPPKRQDDDEWEEF
ncbi:methyl-accepting chemotaxis protein [Marinospirillum alkaliphilum]|uniref:Methyl-accepting chemotaxis sensory transducer with Cache sensor n=1 Tax=Marinospirillum alkaliphilum DSM 21637 TaxID=1122209 RepID=A0A1K1UBN1_9GAMM|nr:methyl-accepting chemotaxis protein [Marinospirillum alkaliphilum]SFX10246.1 methyl-accepting chemotaxis sensory transducer with Cache sensor [Marinospirillum alkaliphilum DSM 21637]